LLIAQKAAWVDGSIHISIGTTVNSRCLDATNEGWVAAVQLLPRSGRRWWRRAL
jgi:hypothetical protein